MTAIRNAADTAGGGRVRAVLFDLDDTLFDHRHCAQSSLRSVHQLHDCFRCRPFDEIERTHGRLLEELHRDVMIGLVDVDAARAERFRRLFQSVGAEPPDEMVRQTAVHDRRAYLDARRAIDGAAELLARIRDRGASIVIVSNNVLEEQQDKLRHCGLHSLIDVLVVSGEEGVSKPDPEIFRRALVRAGCAAAEAVMLGDSWAADIAGARAAGIRAVWFNRHGEARPDAAEDVVELRALEPVDAVVDVLLRPRSTVHGSGDRGDHTHAHRG